jgi:hypothetical protein
MWSDLCGQRVWIAVVPTIYGRTTVRFAGNCMSTSGISETTDEKALKKQHLKRASLMERSAARKAPVPTANILFRCDQGTRVSLENRTVTVLSSQNWINGQLLPDHVLKSYDKIAFNFLFRPVFPYTRVMLLPRSPCQTVPVFVFIQRFVIIKSSLSMQLQIIPNAFTLNVAKSLHAAFESPGGIRSQHRYWQKSETAWQLRGKLVPNEQHAYPRRYQSHAHSKLVKRTTNRSPTLT